MLIQNYNYLLPQERIAKYPLPERDASKMLVYRNGRIKEDTFRNIANYLPADTLMVMNNTRVVRARLHFYKESGARIEIFLLEPLAPRDYEQAFAATTTCTWTCLIGNAKKWKEGVLKQTIQIDGHDVVLSAEALPVAECSHALNGERAVRLCFSGEGIQPTFAAVIESAGELPIPPYLGRDTEPSDLVTYQTVYARLEGSVAAPTAGLHFTPNVLSALDAAGVMRSEVTLHVGAGTFRPVKTEHVEDHTMHAEHISINRNVIEQLLAHGCRCVAIGTTSVRTIESLYYIGRTLLANPKTDLHALHIPQWAPYETNVASPSAEEALCAVLQTLEREGETRIEATTQLMIKPGYQYRFVQAMLTNFHQPKSTLLLLVSAFVGEAWCTVYQYALSHDFRFLSYGDCCLLFKE